MRSVHPDHLVDALCSINTTTTSGTDTVATFFAYLCPRCSDTHLIVACHAEPERQLNIQLTPAQVDRLVSSLLNPVVDHAAGEPRSPLS